MKKYGDIDDIRQELSGKTILPAEMEENLFKRIAEIEADNGVVAPLNKTDWTWIVIQIIVFSIIIIHLFASL